MNETIAVGPHAAVNSPHHEAFVRPYDLAGLKTYELVSRPRKSSTMTSAGPSVPTRPSANGSTPCRASSPPTTCAASLSTWRAPIATGAWRRSRSAGTSSRPAARRT